MCTQGLDKAIFVSGGTGSGQVDRYSVAEDAWQVMPELKQGRSMHSMCALDLSVYVFCGKSTIGKMLNSVERLDLS